MNRNLGLIGKKLGNTQIFEEDGRVVRVTAVETGPCTVVGKRTTDKHGYSALQLGFGTKRAKLVSKAEAKSNEKAGVSPQKVVLEFRLPEDVVAKYEVGQTLKASEVFQKGQFVDVCGTSRGRGFTGVMRRHNFRGSGSLTHGTHEYERHGGAIGMRMTPGRTLPNQRMPGQYGNERVTTQNLRVTSVLDEQNVVFIEGAVPGPRNGIVTVRAAVKKKPVSA